MRLGSFFTKQSIDSGISSWVDRNTKFKIIRKKDSHGLYFYLLENTLRHEKIHIPGYILEQLRTQIKDLSLKAEDLNEINIPIYFKDKCFYHIKTDKHDPNKILIMNEDPQEGSTGFLSFSKITVNNLQKLLFDKRLQHPNNTLSRIISYHKLFQFSFSDASSSITSDLALKKDVLSEIDNFTPALGNSAIIEKSAIYKKQYNRPEGETSTSKSSIFQSHLAERNKKDGYRVDYEKLFSTGEKHSEKFRRKLQEKIKTKKSDKSAKRNQFFAPIMADTIKKYDHVPFKCEYTSDEINELRETFLGDRHAEYFLGIELCDCLFRKNKQLQTYRFPLYYMKINIKESGRFIYIEPRDNGTLFLNHMALANLVDRFGEQKNGINPIDNFFKTLRAQQIEIKNSFDRIYLNRHLPYNLEIFDKTRDLFLGPPHENGMGGLLSNLKLIGIECDLESVFLYKTPKISTPTSKASESDLDELLNLAYSTPNRFYRSLLGQFLSPTSAIIDKKDSQFSTTILSPGYPSPSYKTLTKKLNKHNIVLLEGPPGTGKTFSIMNIVIQAVNEGKRILVVSDKEAALHALDEKIEEYLVGKDFESNKSKHLLYLWRNARKLIDKTSSPEQNLSHFAEELKRQLNLDISDKAKKNEQDNHLEQILAIDKEIKLLTRKIDSIMLVRLDNLSDKNDKVSPKRLHATTVSDINELTAFLQYINPDKPKQIEIVSHFINHRKYLFNEDSKLTEELLRPSGIRSIEKLKLYITCIESILQSKPTKKEDLDNEITQLENNHVKKYILSLWKKGFNYKGPITKTVTFVKTFFRYPINKKLKKLKEIINHQIIFLSKKEKLPGPVWRQLRIIHQAIISGDNTPIPLSLELCQFATKDNEDINNETIQDLLEEINRKQKLKDKLVKELFVHNLREIITSLFKSGSDRKTNPLTTITATLNGLKDYTTLEEGISLWRDLQKTLYEIFPVWFCRKQNVSFMFPCKEQIFDLVIVDEATQCRVDDALPLLFRAKKFLVVGDEKQTVLAKDSVVDDYLFNEFDLDEHLRTTQARGLKGGGSNIFTLIKAIKESSVMLDEHYRCPPEIIEFSNKYVYNNELRTMQWSPIEQNTVFVDYSETKAISNIRQSKGQYKGLETEMIDRFFKNIHKELKKIEAETGKKLNVTTDVAICYFLLKNGPYVDAEKGKHLTKWNRGDTILHGAGTALQGKERDYIFYLWDINRRNMMAFRQGDDPDKRKGELNVLMSRPKKRAYHYLHQNFDQLNHHKSTITDYLWKKYNQDKRGSTKYFQERIKPPGTDYTPWRRYSGQLMEAILKKLLTDQNKRRFNNTEKNFSVIVGDPNYCVDLMLSKKIIM